MSKLFQALRALFTYQRGRPVAVLILFWMCSLSILSEVTLPGGVSKYSGFFTRPFSSARQLLFDGYQISSPRIPQSQPVTIVGIDEVSLAEIGQWPWPRDRLADLLHAIGAYQPAAIGLDMYMPERDQTSPDRVAASLPPSASESLREGLAALPNHEALLAEALFSYPTVLGAAGFDFDTYTTSAGLVSAEVAVSGPDALPHVRRFEAVLASLPELQSAAWGQAILSVDLDFGVVRRIPLVVAVGENLVSGLAMEMLRVASGSPAVSVGVDDRGVETVSVADLVVPTQPGGDAWLHFAEASSTVGRYVSASRVMAGDVDPEQLTGKLVLLGLTGFGLNDMRTTALGELVPGIEIQAQLIESLFDGRFIQRPWWIKWTEIGGILALGLFLVWFIPRTESPLAHFLQTVPRAYLWLTIGLNLTLAGLGLLAFIYLGLLFDAASAFIIFSAIIGSLVSSALIEIEREAKLKEKSEQHLRETAGLVAGGLAATSGAADEAPVPRSVNETELTRLLATAMAATPLSESSLTKKDIDALALAVPNRDVGLVHVRGGESQTTPDPTLPAGVKKLAANKLRAFIADNDDLPAARKRYLSALGDVIESHQECWDGTGYPQGLAGEAIPLAGRIAAVVDAFEQHIGGGSTPDQAVALIEEGAGTRFDPHVVSSIREAVTQLES